MKKEKGIRENKGVMDRERGREAIWKGNREREHLIRRKSSGME